MKKAVLTKFIVCFLLLTLAGFLFVYFVSENFLPKNNPDYLEIVNTLFITYFVLLFFVLVAFIFIFWTFYLPLKKIRVAAMEFANAHFEYDGLDINRNDEIGDVASALNYMASQLSNTRKYQRDFISNISHDFRSPLTSIKGYIEAMMDGTIPLEDHNKYLKIVLAEANRLENLTSGLLNMQDFGVEGTELILTSFDMEEIITEAVETFEGRCEKKNIKIILHFPPKPSLVYGDKGKYEQVLYNLLDNAIKFSYNSSKIIISLYNRGDKLFCSVKDFGPGIPSDKIEKIWQRFYKSDSSRGRDKTGSGIGLSIVKEIIMAHNETINVISTEGAGCEFVFSMTQYKDQ